MSRPRLILGDCREIMRDLPASSVDAVVTDPPYDLGFMNKGWDKTGVAFDATTWHETLRVLKPGGHLATFGGTRTFHRMTCAIEDAGFEIRDCLSWLYGSGFPKSLDVSKAIDRKLGAVPHIVGRRRQRGAKFRLTQRLIDNGGFNDAARSSFRVTTPATPEAVRWSGWGTALKPAWEPIILARKPLCGTVAVNVLAHGTGGLNIDGCRVPAALDMSELTRSDGRWPANVLLDEEGAHLLDGVAGAVPGQLARARTNGEAQRNSVIGARCHLAQRPEPRRDTGGPSRFFYVAKASRAEREAGCDELTPRPGAVAVERQAGAAGLKSPRAGAGRTAKEIRNHHPTVKPVDLMRWLVRLVTPPGGTVLDPFMGSGTTGCACVLESFGFIGIESEPEYLAIAKARITQAEQQGSTEPHRTVRH